MKDQNWKKLGIIYKNGHCSNPTALKIEDSLYRVFYSSRDTNNMSSIFAFDINLDSLKIVNIYKNPLYKFDKKSNYFSSGLTPSSVYKVKNNLYLMFMGWVNLPNEHWYGTIGRLQISEDYFLVPKSDELILGLNHVDKISLSYPEIIKKDNKFFMFYGSTITWDYGNNEMLHTINMAESIDGTSFVPKGNILNYKTGKAQAFSRPSIIIENSKSYHMWYSYRGGNNDFYKIGYANSYGDMFKWNNKYNLSQIQKSNNGWDSQMVEYPNVISYKSKLYMFYNGNGYGKTGIGLAVMDLEDK